MRRGRYYTLSFVVGATWGIIGTFIGLGAFVDMIWGGLIASPFIGIAIGWMSRSMARWPLPYRIAGSLVSLYLAAALFGASIGLADLLVRESPNRIPWAVVAQSVNAVLWGLTVLGWFVLLWPLSFATHWLLAKWNGSHERR